jgi:hypothetical protein
MQREDKAIKALAAMIGKVTVFLPLLNVLNA